MMLVLLSFAAFIFLAFFFNRKQRSQLPPGPIGFPVIGHLHLLGPLIHHSFRDLSFRYGPLFYLNLGSVPCVVASTPELAKEFLKTQEQTFPCRVSSLAIKHLTYNASFAFAPYGPYWKFIKKWTSFELLGNRVINQFAPIRIKEVNHFLQILYSKSKVGDSVNVSEELMKLSNNVISQMVWSVRSSGTDGQISRSVVRDVTQMFGQFNISDFVWFCRNLDLQGFRKRFEETRARYDMWVEKHVTAREQVRNQKRINGVQEHEAKDFLDLILDLMEDDTAEIKLTRDNVKALILVTRASIISFFFSGTDTTAILLEWALSELINHPTVLEKAREEINKVVGNSRIVQECDTPNLPYIQAIIKETFRLHPPIPMVSRTSVQECKFQPERFLQYSNNEAGLSSPTDVRGQHFQLLPFGTGRRICPGIPLAMQELHMTLAATIQCFDLKVINPSGVKTNGNDVLDMTERPGLATPRAHELVCIPVARMHQVLDQLCVENSYICQDV
ncbi:hypothetical protein GH714_003876 [Hevea brasiliensis]|uniref:Flavone synthase II n=1 Tax=Hevea brasiliensis TaxID=3981 RepID=A0A6A6K4N1_HEVBR|nr:hypothetical protein GH714_003876 [Hevea brasiliensis]